MDPTRLLLCFCPPLLLLASLEPVSGQPPAGHAPSFTPAQATAGGEAYQSHCAACHGRDLEGEAIAPALAGERFTVQWSGKALASLVDEFRRMPLPPIGDPGTLSDQTYADILAFVLEANGASASDRALVFDGKALSELVIPSPADGAKRKSRVVELEPDSDPATSRRLLSKLPAVSAELLADPRPEDWLLWRRTQDGLGFSPLDQIDRDNVAQLDVAWQRPLPAGENMASPLVHQGVMYLHTYPDTTLALEASTGQILWRHRYQPQGHSSSKKMGLALHRDRVFVPTSDLHLLALDARTGELIWDHAIATEAPLSEAYQLRAAPLVAGDQVIQGIMSFQVPRGGFVVAVDIQTGRETWRFHTVARPGEPGGHTWNDLPLDQRNGGSVWVTGSYDPELDLVYFGPAPTYDTGPLLHRVDKDGVNNDALYTNATVALNPKSGKLVWHYQHLANDQWDLDWAFERQLLDLMVDGKQRRVVVTVGKSAIVEALDAATGEYLFSIDLGLQNVIESIDPASGKKTIRADSEPSLTDTVLICPSAVGARSWPPTSINQKTRMLFLPLTEGCMTGGPDGFKGLLTTGVGLTLRPHPDSSDGNMGRLQAVNLGTRQLAWSYRQPTPLVSSTLATAGGLVFVGDLEPSLKAFDDRTGVLLWQAALDDTPGATVVTYAVEGRQFVAVVVGQPNNVTRDWTRTYRAQAETRGRVLDETPQGGAAILVFSLAEKR